MGRGIYKSCVFNCDLAFWHVAHRATNRSTSRLIIGQKKCVASTSSVFLAPKCPINSSPCASCNRKRQMEPTGIHRLLVLNKNPSCTTYLFYVRLSLQFFIISLNSSSLTYILFLNCFKSKYMTIKLGHHSISSRQWTG